MYSEGIWRICFFGCLQLIVNSVQSEYTFILERKINESDIVTFKPTTNTEWYLAGRDFVDLDQRNRTWCKQATIFGRDKKSHTVSYYHSWEQLACLNYKEILGSTYFEILKY